MNTGVYKIAFLSLEKMYIGSAQNLAKRKHDHLRELRRETHPNLHLQRAFNKYGENAFRFDILLYCDPINCVSYEQTIMDAFTSERLYNVCPWAGSRLGAEVTEKTRAKMRLAATGNTNSKGQIAWNKGIACSEEQKRIVGNANRRRIVSPETHKKLSIAGQNRSPETRAKVSFALQNYWKKKKEGERCQNMLLLE